MGWNTFCYQDMLAPRLSLASPRTCTSTASRARWEHDGICTRYYICWYVLYTFDCTSIHACSVCYRIPTKNDTLRFRGTQKNFLFYDGHTACWSREVEGWASRLTVIVSVIRGISVRRHPALLCALCWQSISCFVFDTIRLPGNLRRTIMLRLIRIRNLQHTASRRRQYQVLCFQYSTGVP